MWLAFPLDVGDGSVPLPVVLAPVPVMPVEPKNRFGDAEAVPWLSLDGVEVLVEELKPSADAM